MKKQVISFVLVLCLAAGMAVPAIALNEASLAEYTAQAETLKSLGLFLGTDQGFELERSATRTEAAVMVVRLLGKEAEAKSANLSHPFTDVPDWASVYIGYLYENGISNGVSETEYGASLTATPNQFGTFLLRALGYSDADGDFTWNTSLDKMVSLGIITAAEASEYSASSEIPRGVAVALSYKGLFAVVKDTDLCLLERLYITDGAIAAVQLSDAAVDASVSMVAGRFGIASPIADGSAALDSEGIYAKCKDAVFKIVLYTYDGIEMGSASGFFINSNGLAVTNWHVMSALGSYAKAVLNDGSEYNIEGVIGMYQQQDLALIKISGSDFPYLTVGDPGQLRNAQRIYCIGSPLGYDSTISDGLISSTSREYEGSTYIQISAPIAAGSSGGALLNEYGHVVGVTTSGYEDTTLNFAVPISGLAKLTYFPAMRTVRYLEAHINYGYIPGGNESEEQEGNDEAAVQTVPVDGMIFGSISDSDDIDIYTLKSMVDFGTTYVSLTSTVTNSQILKFDVLDSSGAVVFTSNHYANETFSFALGYAENDETYTVKVYSGGSVSEVSYELYYTWLESTWPDDDYSGRIYEFEANNDADHANYVPDDYLVIGDISSTSDKDYYTVYIHEPMAFLIVLMTNTSNPESYNIELINASTMKPVNMERRAYDPSTAGYYVSSLSVGNYYVVVSQASGKTINYASDAYAMYCDVS